MRFLRSINRKKSNNLKSNGLTLIEVLSVVVILGILTLIAVPSYFSFKEKVESEVCYANSYELERMYHSNLLLLGLEHSAEMFHQFRQESFDKVCPLGGEISYLDGKVICSLHPREDGDEDGEDDGGVPYL